MSIIVHDFAVVGPIPAQNISLAKGLAAERARQVLGDLESPYHLSKICDCKAEREAAAAGELDEIKKLDDETEEGFAALARAVLAEVEAPAGALDSAQDGADDGEVVDDDDNDEDNGGEDVDGAAVPVDEDSMDVDSEPRHNGHVLNGHVNGHVNGSVNGLAKESVNGCLTNGSY